MLPTTSAQPAAQPPTEPGRAAQLEGVALVLLMIGIGLAAGAASFTHVHDVAVAHGQPNWIGWADATVCELLSVASGLELRRRKRVGQSVALPGVVLVAAVIVSLGAQVVEAERSPLGWLAAALPALGFLVMVKYVLGRTSAVAPVTAPLVAPRPLGALVPVGPIIRETPAPALPLYREPAPLAPEPVIPPKPEVVAQPSPVPPTVEAPTPPTVDPNLEVSPSVADQGDGLTDLQRERLAVLAEEFPATVPGRDTVIRIMRERGHDGFTSKEPVAQLIAHLRAQRAAHQPINGRELAATSA